MRKQRIMGNWKMNGSVQQVESLLHELRLNIPAAVNVECVVFPPSIYLPKVSEFLTASPITWGAQNVYPKDAGAYTGEVSGSMLCDYGCRYVLVGHSERRRIFHEDEKFVSEKFHHVKDHGMIPVLCIGETLAERENGLTQQVLTQQILAVTTTGNRFFENCVVAYEPVWAIGTGKTAAPDEVQAVHFFVRQLVSTIDECSAGALSIVYGGSVNEKNAAELFAMPDVDGGLIGGASLHAQQFLEIVKCINCY